MTVDLILVAFGALIAVLAVRHALISIREGVVRFPYSPFTMEFTRERDAPLFWGYVMLDLMIPAVVISGVVAALYVREAIA